jgi:hypothetical protein
MNEFICCHTSVATPAVTHSTLPYSVLQMQLVLILILSNTCFLSFLCQYLSKLCAFWDRMPSLVPAFGYQHFGATPPPSLQLAAAGTLTSNYSLSHSNGHNRIALYSGKLKSSGILPRGQSDIDAQSSIPTHCHSHYSFPRIVKWKQLFEAVTTLICRPYSVTFVMRVVMSVRVDGANCWNEECRQI